MITVAVHLFNQKTDRSEKVGDIIYEDGKVRASDPDNYTLATIVHNTVTHPSEGRSVRADREPELWMWLLCVEYQGSYAHCDRPIVNGRRISCEELAERFAPPNE